MVLVDLHSPSPAESNRVKLRWNTRSILPTRPCLFLAMNSAMLWASPVCASSRCSSPTMSASCSNLEVGIHRGRGNAVL
jgi:hypothetical protein